MRKITVYSSAGKKTTINSDVKIYGDLKPQLVENGFEINDSTEVLERVSKTAFTVNEAVLPEGEFTLYVNQSKKIKSGADLSRAELFDFIKNNPEHKGHFRKGALNHTQISTGELNEMYNSLQENLNILPKKSETKSQKIESKSVVAKVEKNTEKVSSSFLLDLRDSLQEAYDSSDWDMVETTIESIDNYLNSNSEELSEDEQARMEMKALFGK